MAITVLGQDELDRRIMELAKDGVYKNSLYEAFPTNTKVSIDRALGRLKRSKQIATLKDRSDPELGTYYEALHWIGEKPLLGPPDEVWDLSVPVEMPDHLRVYRLKEQAWSEIENEVNHTKFVIAALGKAGLAMGLFFAIAGLANSNIYRLALIAGPMGIGVWVGTTIAVKEMSWIEERVKRINPQGDA